MLINAEQINHLLMEKCFNLQLGAGSPAQEDSLFISNDGAAAAGGAGGFGAGGGGGAGAGAGGFGGGLGGGAGGGGGGN